jgi:hypothetical protein
MIVDKIVETYREQVEEFSQNIFRASLAGKCPRRLGFQRLGVPGHPQIRAYLTFELGDAIHRILRDRIRLAFRNGLLTEIEKIEFEDEVDPNQWEIILRFNGFNITGHPDGRYWKKDGVKGLIEFKSMSNYAFKRALKGEIDYDYLVQAGIYILGSDDIGEFTWILYRKETSHLLELRISPFIDQMKLMEREDLHFILLEKPFDIKLEPIVEKYNKILTLETIDAVINSFPTAVNPGVCHNCGGLGQKEYGKCRVCKGRGLLDPPFEIGYPCNYCPYWNICYPEAVLEFEEGKPKLIIGG